MKHFLLASTAIALTALTPANAADLGKPVYKAPAAVAVYNWTGPYLGGFVGGAWSDSVDVREGVSQGGAFPPGDCYNTPRCAPYGYSLDSSVIAGLTAGYNWQAAGSPFVFGLEGEFGFLRLKGTGTDPNSLAVAGGDTNDSTKIGDWYGLVAGRLGYAWDRTLIYVKGGAAFLPVKTAVVDVCTAPPCGGGTVNASASETVTGWTVGGGFEWAWTENWSLKAEYLLIGLGETVSTCGPGGGLAAGSTYCWTHDLDNIHTVKVGLNYKFNWGKSPVVAKY